MKFTVERLREKSAVKLGDPFMNKWTPQVLDSVINEAQDFVVSETECLFRVFELNPVADEGEYDLRDVDSTGKDLVIKVLGVLWDNDTFLKIYNQREFDVSSSGWRTESSGTPTKSAVDGNILTLCPAPDASGGWKIRLLTIAYADDLVEDGDPCIIPARLQRYIPIYVFNFLTNRDADNEALKKILQRERSREGIMKASRKFIQKVNLVRDFKNYI